MGLSLHDSFRVQFMYSFANLVGQQPVKKKKRGLVFFQNTIPLRDQFIELKVPNYAF